MKITCPRCNTSLSVPESAAGKKGRCPCGEVLAIPAADPADNVYAMPNEPSPFAQPPSAVPAPAASSVAPPPIVRSSVPQPTGPFAAPPPVPQPTDPLAAAPPIASAAACPACSQALPAGAILCTSCGHDLRTGRRMTAASPLPPAGSLRVPPRRPAPQQERGGFFGPERRGISKGVLGGLIMMGIAAVWFFGGLAVDIIFFYPPILFLIGLFALIKGLLTGNLSGRE